jgi:hypothetical protein
MAQGVEHLPSKCVTFSSNPSTVPQNIERSAISRMSMYSCFAWDSLSLHALSFISSNLTFLPLLFLAKYYYLQVHLGWGYSSVLEFLPSLYEALGYNPSHNKTELH